MDTYVQLCKTKMAAMTAYEKTENFIICQGLQKGTQKQNTKMQSERKKNLLY